MISRIAIAVGFLALALMPQPVNAQGSDDGRWVRRSVWSSCDFWGSCQRYVYRDWDHRRRYVQSVYREYRPQREPEVRGYIRRDSDWDIREDRVSDCKDRRRVVGDQGLSISLAQGQADKAWAQDVRFRFGERYMDLKNARAITYECSRSSVGEALGQVFNRCQVSAVPCAAPKTEADGGR